MIPQDPMILLSYLNTQLRDYDSSLDELCRRLGLDLTEIQEKMRHLDYHYSREQNRFV